MTGAFTSGRIRFTSLVTALLLPMVVAGTGDAFAQSPALERCRETVGKRIVQSCMQAGGNLPACREKASPRVRACVQAAMGAGGVAKGGGGGGGAQRVADPGAAAAGPLVGKARQMVMNGQYIPAVEILNKAIAQDPNFSFAYMWRATARQRMGQSRNPNPISRRQ